jgi:flagellum-specific peptidoglycan hydrolase FlgJ
VTPEQAQALLTIADAAVAAERTTGCPAEISTAQCIIESAWLTEAPQNNSFGVKAYAGCYGRQLLPTTEWFTDAECARFLAGDPARTATLKNADVPPNGSGRRESAVQDWFATFATLADCFAFHGALLQRGVYAGAWATYQANHDLDGYIQGIAAHYATDPTYAAQIIQLAHGPHVTADVVAARETGV